MQNERSGRWHHSRFSMRIQYGQWQHRPSLGGHEKDLVTASATVSLTHSTHCSLKPSRAKTWAPDDLKKWLLSPSGSYRVLLAGLWAQDFLGVKGKRRGPQPSQSADFGQRWGRCPRTKSVSLPASHGPLWVEITRIIFINIILNFKVNISTVKKEPYKI